MDRPRYWLSRLLLASWLLSIGVTTTLEPDAFSTRILREVGLFGILAPAALLMMALGATLDSVINDILPPRYVLITRHWRHVFYPLAGMLLTIMTAVIAHRAGFRPLLISYLLPCFWCFALTFLQIFAKPRQGQ